MNNDKVEINSEIGRLRKVIVHSPGREIQDMTPKTAEQLLYNDIIPLSVVSKEHETFKRVLERFSEVYEYSDLLIDVLEDEDIRNGFVDSIVRINKIPSRREELAEMSPAVLTDVVITGLPQKKNSLEKYLSGQPYDINPLPNLYFTRDAAMVYGSKLITGCMASSVRQTESEIAAAVFSVHPGLKNNGFLIDGRMVARDNGLYNRSGFSIEGGDFLALSEDCIIIGCSERTTARAIDAVAASFDRELTVFVVILPHERAAIHLDMVLVQLDLHDLMVYKPFFFGQDKMRIIRIKVIPGRESRLSEADDLFEALRAEGHDFNPIFCGNADPIQQQREQWLSGNNFLAVAPGIVIGYACNNYTMEALGNCGYEIMTDKEFLYEKENVENYRKLVIGISGVELARGGGGARCMTLPIQRLSL